MTRVHIGFVINSIKKCGPVEVLLNQLSAIDQSKYRVTVITLLNDNDDSYITNKFSEFELIKLDYPKNVFTLFQFLNIAKTIDLYNFGIIHIHGHITNFLIHKVRCKKIVTVHNRLFEDFKDIYGNLFGLLVHYLNIYFLKKNNKVVFCSEAAYQYGKKYKLDATFVRNGISSTITCEQKLKIRQKLRGNLQIPENSFVYLYAGVLSDTKNVRTMIDYFANNLLSNEYFIVLGDGKYFNYLKRFATEQIKVLGFKENVIEYMQVSDCYVSFSKSEGFPISVIEAMSCNLSLFLSDIPSHMEFCRLNKELYVGECFSEENIGDRLNLVRENKEIQSREVYEKYLTNYAMMNAYHKIYDQVIGDIK